MLVEQLIRETLEMQGFRIASVEKLNSELFVNIVADLRYHPRCGRCGTPGATGTLRIYGISGMCRCGVFQ
jgi:hypothetical protein